MEIQKTSATPSISSNAHQPPKDFSKLPANSVLNAVVINKLDESTYILKLFDGNLIRAHTDNELQLGQILKLEVVKTGTTPELKIVWPGHSGTITPLMLQNALRQLLPKQINLTDFTLALRQVATLKTDSTTPISAAIQEALGSMLSKDDLTTAEGVKQGIDNSGGFLEAKLAHQLTPQNDIKGQLMVLANTLQKTALTPANPGLAHALPQDVANALDTSHSLLAKTEGAIAHIVLNQLASLPQNNEPQNIWHVSIPYVDGSHTDTINLKIKREENPNQTHHQPNWSVMLELNPPGMGTLNCKISLIDNKIDTYFWSDAQDGIMQVQDNLDLLANRYTSAGLSVGNLNTVDASRMKSESAQKELALPLLDELA